MLKRIMAVLLIMALLLSCLCFAQAKTYKTLKRGSKGVAVRKLQTALKKQDFYSGKIDGIYGKSTVKAVKAFQKANGLKADGIAGSKTQELLYAKKANTSDESGTNGNIPENALSLLESIKKKSKAVCGTVILSKNGKTFLTWSFGGVSGKTCFRIASITKWVTAIGLMTLYDQGKLDLDKDIGKYLGVKVRNPAFPDVPITARMLLSHTSSLSAKATNYHPDWNRIGKNGYNPIFDKKIKPGSRFVYADYNGALFGALIEAISKQSVQTYLNKTVFKPLGITAAYSPKFLPSGTPTMDLLNKKGKVEISVKKDRNRTYNNKADPLGNNGYTVGKLYISAEGLTRLAQMMYYHGELNGVRVLNEQTVSLMEADQTGLAESKYGLSTVRLNQFDRGTWYGHQGRYSGLTSNVYYQRETGITIALIMDGYNWKLEDNIVTPAVTLLKNMAKLEELCVQ